MILARRSFLIGLAASFVAPNIPLAADVTPVPLVDGVGKRLIIEISFSPISASRGGYTRLTLQIPGKHQPEFSDCVHNGGYFVWRTLCDGIPVSAHEMVKIITEPTPSAAELLITSRSERGLLVESFTWINDQMFAREVQFLNHYRTAQPATPLGSDINVNI